MNMLVNVHLYKKPLLIIFLMGLSFSMMAQAHVWSLQQCVDTAKASNKNLLMAKNNILISEQREQEAKANLIPKLNVVADYRYYIDLPYQFMPQSAFGGPEGVFKEIQFGVPHNINASLQLSIPLYNPQVYGSIHATKIASELSDLQYQKSEEQIIFEVTNLYYNAQVLHFQISFLNGNIVNTKKLLDNVQLLKEQLLAKGTDVSKVKLQLEQLAAHREQLLSKYSQVLNALKITIGISVDRDFGVDTVIVQSESTEYTQSATLDSRLVNKQNALLNSELSALKHSRLPSLSLYGNYGATGFGYDKAPNDFLKFYPVSFAGVQLSYPLFNGTISNRKINQKKMELKNNELQSGLLSEQTSLLVETAQQQRLIANRSIVTTQSQIQLAQSIYDQTLLQQQQGVASLTDVLLADNALRESQQNYLSATIEYLKADLELKKATGNMLIK